jgi:hypothetical protein
MTRAAPFLALARLARRARGLATGVLYLGVDCRDVEVDRVLVTLRGVARREIGGHALGDPSISTAATSEG